MVNFLKDVLQKDGQIVYNGRYNMMGQKGIMEG